MGKLLDKKKRRKTNNKKYTFLRPSWVKHYFFWVIIFLIFIIFITFIQIPESNIMARIIIIAALIFYFIFGHFFAIYSFDFVKKLFTNIINLNNYSYGDLTPKRKIPVILVILPFYLIIFQIYFIVADYSFIEALIFGWLVLIFIRSSHYVDKTLGAKIGLIIGSFFIPFGFIIFLIKSASFYIDLSTGIIFIEDYLPYLFYFITFILATLPLEVLMDYRGKNKQIDDKKKRKMTEWKKDPSFVKYIKK